MPSCPKCGRGFMWESEIKEHGQCETCREKAHDNAEAMKAREEKRRKNYGFSDFLKDILNK